MRNGVHREQGYRRVVQPPESLLSLAFLQQLLSSLVFPLAFECPPGLYGRLTQIVLFVPPETDANYPLLDWLERCFAEIDLAQRLLALGALG